MSVAQQVHTAPETRRKKSSGPRWGNTSVFIGVFVRLWNSQWRKQASSQLFEKQLINTRLYSSGVASLGTLLATVSTDYINLLQQFRPKHLQGYFISCRNHSRNTTTCTTYLKSEYPLSKALFIYSAQGNQPSCRNWNIIAIFT